LSAPDGLRHGDLAAFEPSGEAVDSKRWLIPSSFSARPFPTRTISCSGITLSTRRPRRYATARRTSRRSSSASLRKAVC